MSRKAPPGPPRLKRTHGLQDQLPRIFVACEGATEKQCLCSLRSRWRIPSIRVEVAGEVGEPRAVVRKAKTWWPELKRRRKRRVKDEIWVVFDCDDHPHWKAALDQALALDFGIADSNPCIELWGLLLHRDQEAYINRDNAQHDLAGLHPGYHHTRNPYFDIDAVLERFNDAHARAEHIWQRAPDYDDPFKNPTTRFHVLVARIRELKSPDVPGP